MTETPPPDETAIADSSEAVADAEVQAEAELETHDDRGWDRTYALNVLGVFRLTRELLPALTRGASAIAILQTLRLTG